jgi:hypothetical protein
MLNGQLLPSSFMQTFPKFELSYEMITHKKVFDSNVILAIPRGERCVAWFTQFQEENICCIFEVNSSREILTHKPKKILNTVPFANAMVNGTGTILYGTLFQEQYFCVEDIYYYAGIFFGNHSYLAKLKKMRHIFHDEISQMATDRHFIIFGLPFLTHDIHIMMGKISSLPYIVSHFQHRFFDSKKNIVVPHANSTVNMKESENVRDSQEQKKIMVFNVTADIKPDIYYLFNKEEYHDVAFVPDYKTSVMMNKLFRNIRENEDLDKIEESEDESDFENVKEDKYVFLDRSIKMTCEYNRRFKRWTPIQPL